MKTNLTMLLVAIVLYLPKMVFAGTILQDDFESGTLSGWSCANQGRGTPTFAIANVGGSKALNINGNGSCATGSIASTNYVIDADVYIYDDSYQVYAVGVLFGAGAVSGLYSMDGHVFQARPSWYEIEKWTNGGSWQRLVMTNGQLPSRTWNHMKVEVNGSNVKCYANDNLIFNQQVSGVTGGVGFRTWGAGAYFDNLTVTMVCGLDITGFSGTSTIINPSSGGKVRLSGNIADTSGKPVTWTLSIAGKTYQGTGTAPEVTWDGTDAYGKVVEPGTYTATLTAQTSDGCSDEKSIPFNVEPPPENSCSLYVDFGSSANLASGALAHNQELFVAKRHGTASGMSLYYNSKDPHSASLGTGWSHSYDISLKQNSDGSAVFRDGNGRRKLYTLSGDSYISRPGDYSILVKGTDGTFTLTDSEGLKYLFGQHGKIISIVNRNSNVTNFTYLNGNLAAITDSVGRTTALSYDESNRIISIADPAGNSYAFAYDGATLASVTYPDGGVWRYTYDANGFMLSKTDPLGKTTTYAYDASHRVVSSTDPEGRNRTVAYPEGSDTVRSTTFTEKDGGAWIFRYDTKAGTLASKVDPMGGVTSHAYDASGNRISTTGADGSTTTYTYDARGNVTSITDPEGHSTVYTFNSLNNMTSVTDPEGKVTTYGYDTRGNLTSSTDPAGATTLYEYDDRGALTKRTDPMGQVTSYSYDMLGNLASVTDPAGESSSFTYDAAGNMTGQSDANGATTRFQYNANNKVVRITDPLGNATTYAYDANGNRISQTDGNGNTTSYAYNYKGQITQITDPLGNTTRYSYGAAACSSCGGGTDKLTSITDANGNTTSYSYDSLGRIIKETDPLGSQTAYSYDAKGRLAARTDANGNTVTQTYDGAGNVTGRFYPDGASESFVYDRNGNLLNWQTPAEIIDYSYDPASRLTAKAYQNLGKAIRYEYDAAGRKSAMIDPEGGRTVYEYGPGGRVTKVTDPSGNWASYSYGPSGRRSAVAYSNGTSTAYTYDSAGRLLSMTTTGPSGVISSYEYTYDKVGNRLSVNSAVGTSTTYTYDKLYRLTGYDESRPDASKGTFTYDPLGNRLSMLLAKKYLPNDSRTYAYSYNAANQLVDVVQKGRQSPIETVFSYDKAGGLLSRAVTQGRTTATTRYSYDFWGRLSKVLSPDGKSVTIENLSDGFNRLSKTSSSGTTRYFHDGMSVLSEYDATGNRASRYTLGINIDDIIASTDSAGTYFYNYDGLGSVTSITDATGKVVVKYDYEPFGRMKETLLGVTGNPYSFTGREWDKESGLYYYRARYYDPVEGRFTSKDPIGFEGGINLYNYTHSNPINKIDPFGLRPPAMDPGTPSGDFTVPATYVWDPNDNGSFTNAYCSVVSKAISICLDRASIEAALTKSLPGFAIYGMALTNSAVSFTICPGGVSPSTVTTVLGGAPKPSWFGPVMSVVDAVLTALGH